MSDFDALREQHNNHNFRAPTDLQVTPTELRRGLFIGSCFAEAMAHETARTSGIPHDFILYQPEVALKNCLTRPIEDYDFLVVSFSLRYLIPENGHIRLDFSDEAACQTFFDDCCQRLYQWLDDALVFSTENHLLTFFANFLVPQQNPLGRLLRKKSYSNICYVVQRLNEVLEEEVLQKTNCYIVDLDSIANSFGKKFIVDETMWIYNHGTVRSNWDWEMGRDHERLEVQPIPTEHFETRTIEYFDAIWREIEASIRTVRQQDSIKLVLVDLDDTMWRGIIGEDRLSPLPIEGWPIGFAEALHYLKKRGIVLGILSKNDDSRIVEKFNQIYDVIHLEDFATRRINWNPKTVNFEAVLADVNVLPRNVLFIDDNPVERDSIKAAYPDVRVLGSHPYYFKQILMGAPETQVAVLTDETLRRTEMIQSQIEREGSRKRMTREEFLASLGLKVSAFEVADANDPKFARAFELLNKTNQFNTTGQRWTIEQIGQLWREGGKLLAFEAQDKFTQYGLISLAIIRGNEIIQTVMSCRVIGMEVEKSVLAFTESQLQATDGRLIANYTATASNALCRDLYNANGYAAEGEAWVKGGDARIAVPVHISLAQVATA